MELIPPHTAGHSTRPANAWPSWNSRPAARLVSWSRRPTAFLVTAATVASWMKRLGLILYRLGCQELTDQHTR